jgi:hypothetical protein
MAAIFALRFLHSHSRSGFSNPDAALTAMPARVAQLKSGCCGSSATLRPFRRDATTWLRCCLTRESRHQRPPLMRKSRDTHGQEGRRGHHDRQDHPERYRQSRWQARRCRSSLRRGPVEGLKLIGFAVLGPPHRRRQRQRRGACLSRQGRASEHRTAAFDLGPTAQNRSREAILKVNVIPVGATSIFCACATTVL